MRIKRPDWHRLWNNAQDRVERARTKLKVLRETAPKIDPQKLAVVGAGTVLAGAAFHPMVQAVDIVASPPQMDLTRSVVMLSPECNRPGDVIEFTRPDGTQVRATLKKAWELRGQSLDSEVEADLCRAQRALLPEISNRESRSLVAQTKVALRLDDFSQEKSKPPIDRGNRDEWVTKTAELMKAAEKLEADAARAASFPAEVAQERNDIYATLSNFDRLRAEHPWFGSLGKSVAMELSLEAAKQQGQVEGLSEKYANQAKEAQNQAGKELEALLGVAAPTWAKEHRPDAKLNVVAQQMKSSLLDDLRSRVKAGQPFNEIAQAIETSYLKTEEHRSHHLDEAVRQIYAPHLGPYRHASLNVEIAAQIERAEQMRDQQIRAGRLDVNAIIREITGASQRSVEFRKSWSEAGDPHSLLPSELKQVTPLLSDERARELIPHLNKAMTDAKIAPGKERAAFVAQLAQESIEFNYFEEIADGSAYEGNWNLGNTHPGDGMRYKGRGPIQITGRSNYRAAGQALGIDLESHPELASRTDIGFRVAAWYWTARDIAEPARAGDFDEVTRRINGGDHGLADRVAYYQRALKAIG